MVKLKLVLSLASLGLIYYGSQSLYSLFATPAIQYGKHAVRTDTLAGGMAAIPGGCALLAGLALAFGCIFWWIAGAQRKPRRYDVPAYQPQVSGQTSVPTGRTLADMPVPMAPKSYTPQPRVASTNYANRNVHGITTESPRVVEKPVSTGTASPPPLDPY